MALVCDNCHANLDPDEPDSWFSCGGCLDRHYCSVKCSQYDWVTRHQFSCSPFFSYDHHISTHSTLLTSYFNSLLSHRIQPEHARPLASIHAAPAAFSNFMDFADTEFDPALVSALSDAFIAWLRSRDPVLLDSAFKSFANFFFAFAEEHGASVQELAHIQHMFSQLYAMLYSHSTDYEKLAALIDDLGMILDTFAPHTISTHHADQHSFSVPSFEEGLRNHAFATHLLYENPHLPHIPKRVICSTQSGLARRILTTGAQPEYLDAYIKTSKEHPDNPHVLYNAAAQEGAALDKQFPSSPTQPLFELKPSSSSSSRTVSFTDPLTQTLVEEPILFESHDPAFTWIATKNYLLIADTEKSRVIVHSIANLANFSEYPVAEVKIGQGYRGFQRAFYTATGRGKKLTEKKAGKRNDLLLEFGSGTGLRYLNKEKFTEGHQSGVGEPIVLVALTATDLAAVNQYHPVLRSNTVMQQKIQEQSKARILEPVTLPSDAEMSKIDSIQQSDISTDLSVPKQYVIVERAPIVLTKTRGTKVSTKTGQLGKNAKYFNIYRYTTYPPSFPSSPSSSSSSAPPNDAAEYARLSANIQSAPAKSSEYYQAKSVLASWLSSHPSFTPPQL
jgi:hypothetical protein